MRSPGVDGDGDLSGLDFAAASANGSAVDAAGYHLEAYSRTFVEQLQAKHQVGFGFGFGVVQFRWFFFFFFFFFPLRLLASQDVR